MMMRHSGLLAALFGTGLALAACDTETDTGEGTLSFRISGEGPATDGYPFVKDGVELSFVEGWEVQFDHIVASMGEISVAATDGTVAHQGTERYLADLAQGDVTVLTLPDITARRWDRIGVNVLPASSESIALSGIDASIVDTMVSEGLTYYYDGRASRDGMSFRFVFGLRNPTTNTDCTNGDDSTQGVIVENGSFTESELTVHIDHLFWDTLGSEQLRLRFDAMAAADLESVGGNGDGVITFEELENQRLSDLRGLDGEPLLGDDGEILSYNPASTPLSESTLRGFVLASTATQVHLNGLGFCTIQSSE
ncbi:MAG: hypothetical protein AAGA56_00995 [Myxococcota bacterium]